MKTRWSAWWTIVLRDIWHEWWHIGLWSLAPIYTEHSLGLHMFSGGWSNFTLPSHKISSNANIIVKPLIRPLNETKFPGWFLWKFAGCLHVFVASLCIDRTTSLCGKASRPAKERNDTYSSSKTSCFWRARGNQKNPGNFPHTSSEEWLTYVLNVLVFSFSFFFKFLCFMLKI